MMLKYIYVPDMKLGNNCLIRNVNFCNTGIINCKLINQLNVSWNFANGSSNKSACDGQPKATQFSSSNRVDVVDESKQLTKAKRV